jgi:hypothetical protein
LVKHKKYVFRNICFVRVFDKKENMLLRAIASKLTQST